MKVRSHAVERRTSHPRPVLVVDDVPVDRCGANMVGKVVLGCVAWSLVVHVVEDDRGEAFLVMIANPLAGMQLRAEHQAWTM